MKEQQASTRVLVVDDDILMRMLFSLFLRRCGVPADVVGSVQQAILRLAKTHYSLILVDGHLGDGTGSDVATFARRDSYMANVPIVAISSDSRNEHVQQLLAAGVNQFIKKPVTGDTIRHLLEHYSLIATAKAERASAQSVATPDDV